MGFARVRYETVPMAMNNTSLTGIISPSNNPLHTEPRLARFGVINVVRRGPVNGNVIAENRSLKLRNQPFVQ